MKLNQLFHLQYFNVYLLFIKNIFFSHEDIKVSECHLDLIY